MKFLAQVCLCCLFVSGAFAQRGGHGGGVGRGGFVGGGVGRGGFVGGHVGGFGHGFRGGFVGGFGYGRGFRGFGYGRFGYRRFGFGGLYWPGLWSGFWGWPDYGYYGYPDYGYPYYPASYGPNVTVVYPEPAQPAYPVVVDQPAHPVIHEYRQPEDYGLPSEHQNRPVLYLIAFNDHVIRPALAYWVERGSVHYLDMDHKEKEAPLSSVDQRFSMELNRERHVPFQLGQNP